MQKHFFYAGTSANTQNKNEIKIVDINILLNRVKIDEKNKKKRDIKIMGFSLLIISTALFFII
jgi:hypothetical protein|tara:strand:- start:359 stop:547 length:189 start_codon:yes stop_codon:yes gene_type:complete